MMPLTNFSFSFSDRQLRKLSGGSEAAETLRHLLCTCAFLAVTLDISS